MIPRFRAGDLTAVISRRDRDRYLHRQACSSPDAQPERSRGARAAAYRPARSGSLPDISRRDSCNPSPSPRGGRRGCLEWAHRQRTTPRSPQMITAFFAFVTVSFFVAITANVVEAVATARA